MPSAKDKKAKNKLLKIDMSSGSDDDSEHELSYYAKDKVKLMKEVLKLIKPKKIKSMAPDCIKNLDIVEINSMLLEELLGISNKRLQYIFNGEPADRETSSSESEEEKQPIDVISLDDISDDDDIELCISQSEKDALESGLSKKNKHKLRKIKTEPGGSAIKLEKVDKSKKDNKKKSKKVGESSKQFENLKESEKEKLMSVLELLELQARARAIRSQLAIETDKKGESSSAPKVSVKQESDSDSDAVIVDTPQHKEIVITSESEDESLSQNKASSADHSVDTEIPPQKKQKITEEDSAEPSTATKQENETADSNKEIDTVDLTEQESESDLKSRKEKLLTKIQKIKLVRNRILSGIDQPKNKPDTINCPGSSNDAAVEQPSANIETPPIVDVNESTTEKVSEDKSENSEQKSDSVIALDEASSSKENKSDIKKSPENADKVEEASKHLPSKKQNITDCDNDEIVINLDEDEMDDMDND